MRRTRIAGIGRHLPERVVTNEELASLMDTSDAWIRERTGIRERRWADADTTCTDLGAAAASAALEDAGWRPDEVGFLIFATLSPDLYFPGNGVLLQQQLGLPEIGALDIRTQCTGFLYGLSTADAFIRAGFYDRVLLVGAEIHSKGMWRDLEGRDTAVIFGDGAGAVCLEAVPADSDSYLITHRLHSDGRYAEELCVKKPGNRGAVWLSAEQIENRLTAPYMNGREVFRHAVTRFPEVIEAVLEAEGATAADLAMVIPHQANLRITEAVRQRLGLPAERVYSNIERYGNTTAGSIPIALSEAVEEGRIRRGDLVCLAAFGAGFTWAASLLRY